jgi:hypothetical protein
MTDEERWAERMKPSRQQNLTPEQRRSRANILWGLRQAKARSPGLGCRASVSQFMSPASCARTEASNAPRMS